MDSTPEEEYVEVEGLLTDWLAGRTLRFTRDVLPYRLANGVCDLYLFDMGGLCRVDFSGDRCTTLAREVLRQSRDHPSTLFVPWSTMTRDYVRLALQEALPEWEDPDAVLPADSEAPKNVIVVPKSVDLQFNVHENLEHFRKKIQEWFR
jgi:hypothetical protein